MYDQTTGQVYTEWTVSRRRISAKSDLDWSQRRPYGEFTPHGERGSRSLLDMAMNVAANHVGQLSEKHLENIATPLLWRIWRLLEERGVCFHAWELFSAILLREDDGDKKLSLYRFRHRIPQPEEDLKCYTQPVTSLATEFITHLILGGGCSFSIHDMLCLTDIKNLGILELIQTPNEAGNLFPNVSDRLIRGWTEKENPFPLLRILRIWGSHDITENSLRWASKFPSLVLYDVEGPSFDWIFRTEHATQAGWEVERVPPGSRVDMLTDYLVCLAPVAQREDVEERNVYRSVHHDIVSLCGDSDGVVKFVGDGQAPWLLDFLTDENKAYVPSGESDAAYSLDTLLTSLEHARRISEARHGIVLDEWAFFLYGFIGQLIKDRDLERQGARPNKQAVAGHLVLPSRPLACLSLGGTKGDGISTTVTTRHTKHGLFTRVLTTPDGDAREAPEPADKKRKKKPDVKTSSAASARSAPPLRPGKRKRMDDLLQSLSR